ncbi:hypothetical protein L1049_016168 [Liquidambar formosana]|uniref:C3HC-type domain-containing protein n=1 Tax=Liquidambar formosana TaxID=63359 RepID=A0AAP0S0U1_LIQFO
MSDDTEKRFHSIMDKLFYAPKPKPNPSSSSGVQSARGKKRPNPTSALSVVESKSRGEIVEAPMCRPWDRGDLMRRLATFKSMTWFGKPKVVSAVNCATRGWVNIDMDIIACEACGARLLFSTPSSWTQQQVEKAARVFSLKLDNGHKLLCPWIDNACAEKLAQFPPMTAPVLVDGYRKRCSALSKLLALPVISSSAIDHMRSPQLEHFLKQSSMQECGNWSTDTSQTKSFSNDCESVSSNLYYQAQKLISLCGWEPRSLPYLVDRKDPSTQSAKDASRSDLSHVVAIGHNPNICFYSAGTNEIVEPNEDPTASGGLQSDPNSVVLDCSLCGASVGLWAFSIVPPPVELFRLVGYSEVNGEKDSEGVEGLGTHDSGNEHHVDGGQGVVNTTLIGATSSKDRLLNLNLTIAGGPPPTTQNFRATISLPIIGQNLRARFSSDSDFGDRIINQETIRSDSCNKNLFQEGKDHIENTPTGQVVQPEDIGLLKGKRHDDGHCSSTSDDQLTSLNNNSISKGDTARNDYNDQLSLEGTNVTGQGLNFPETGRPYVVMESTTESMQNVAQGSDQNNKLSENEENVGTVTPAVRDFGGSLVGDSSITTLGASAAIRNGEISENDSLGMVADDFCILQQLLGTDIVCSREISAASHQEPSFVASCTEAGVNVDNASKIDLREGNNCSDIRNTSGAQNTSQEGNGVKDRVHIPVNNEVASGIGKDLKQLPLDKAMEFDPIRQHRHFCPWITSTGTASPGWQQTLSALQRQKEFSYPSPTESPSSAAVIEVDDPIASVRRLFMSPSAKRMKSTHGSS